MTASLGAALAIAIAALGLVAVAPRTLRAANAERFESARLGALGLLAVAAFASYYGFFQVRHHGGWKDTDVYHYYMGSKYFPELGYQGLYNCTVRVLSDAGELSRFDLPPVRDMRTMQMQSDDQTLARAHRCPEHFSAARWSAFERDVLWFSRRMPEGRWTVILRDHGFHPTPVWTFVGRAVVSAAPLGSSAFEWMLLADRGLMLLAIGSIVWAFGFEAGAIAMIVWGVGHHWGYAWIGDAMLRTLWLSMLIIGLCLLRREKFAASGALIAFSGLLRIFPFIFIVAFALAALRRFIATRAIDAGTRRFSIGALAACLILILASALFDGRGLAAHAELAEKMSAFSAHPSENKLGLSALVWRIVMTAAGHLSLNEAGLLYVSAPATAAMKLGMRGLQLIVAIPAVLLYWRATREVEPWLATVLAAALIPILSSPTNYYYGFFLLAVMAMERNHTIAVMLLGVVVLWLANGIALYGSPDEYLWASVLAVAFSFAWLASMLRRSEPLPRSPALRPGQ